MKFVGSIKGKNFLIDPETYEAEIREKIAKEILANQIPTSSHTHLSPLSPFICRECILNDDMEEAAQIARGQK